MGLTLSQRKAVTRQIATRYQHADKKQRGRILDEFCATTEYNRSYASFLLHNWGRKVTMTINGVRTIYCVGRSPQHTVRGRPPTYDRPVRTALKTLWIIADGICGKRLASFIRATLPILERYEELVLDQQSRKKLLTISPATIDRLLASERVKFKLKGRARTKPGTLLKHQIPIRTFSQWDNHLPGFVEIDLVSHEGGYFQGDNIYTLDLTDIATKWTETRAVINKAQRWVFDALKDIITFLPFSLRGIDSDNGSEFINNHLFRYCDQQHLTFTRSRPYRKNDNCFVEQKNYSVVRRAVGYYRYDTPEELTLLNQLYQSLRLYTNFFLPAMNMIQKTRIGSKITKIYDQPQTPYQRLLAHTAIPELNKDLLRHQYQQLNPAALKREISLLQDKLFDIASSKRKLKQHYTHDPSFSYISR